MSQNRRGTIPIDGIVEDFFVRTRLNDDHVLHLATLYEAGTKLPPILITREIGRLIDGRHRLAALRLLGKKAVDVEWDDETDDGKLLVHALKNNIGGSLPPSNGDIVYAIRQMLEAGMVGSAVTKSFSEIWPSGLIRRYISDAQSLLNKDRIIKARTAIVEEGLTINDAAVKFKVNLEALKSAMQGKRTRRGGVGESKAALTKIFRSRGGSLGALIRKLQEQFDDGDLSFNSITTIMDHYENLAKGTLSSARDARKRFEAKASKKSAA